MKTIKMILLSVVVLTAWHSAAAQEPVVGDSIMVFGAVLNQRTLDPEPFCLVQFIGEREDTVNAVCDDEGFFAVEGMPVGMYTMKVKYKGLSLYQESLALNSNTDLTVKVVTDTIRFIGLPAVDVLSSRPKHLLAKQDLLITETSDPRLWNFNFRWWIAKAWGGGYFGFGAYEFGAPASVGAPRR